MKSDLPALSVPALLSATKFLVGGSPSNALKPQTASDKLGGCTEQRRSARPRPKERGLLSGPGPAAGRSSGRSTEAVQGVRLAVRAGAGRQVQLGVQRILDRERPAPVAARTGNAQGGHGNPPPCRQSTTAAAGQDPSNPATGFSRSHAEWRWYRLAVAEGVRPPRGWGAAPTRRR